MVTTFDKIREDAPAPEAIRMIFNGKVRPTGHKTVSLMVVDDFGKLAGIITMFDILYHLRPDFLNYGVSGDDLSLSWQGQLQKLVASFEEKAVHQIMSTVLLGAYAEEHIMVILDRMIKNRYRRLPVLENDRPIGIVYLSDIYHHIFKDYGE
jgi:CBS domain-containing protein